MYLFALGIIVMSHMSLIAESLPPSCEESGITSTKMKCWASCDLGRCGIKFDKPTSYIRCSWESQNVFNYTMSLDFENKKPCKISSAEYDRANGIYSQTFYTTNCPSVGLEADGYVTAWMEVYDHTGLKCEEMSAFRICTSSKPDPPVILGITWDGDSHLLFNISKPSCSPHQLEYKVKYNRTNGHRSKKGQENKDDAKPYMRYREATEFNYTIQGTTDGNVYSDRIYGSFITGPKKALENKSFHFVCSVANKNKYFNATISWKKMGIIDHFDVKVYETQNESLAILTQVHKKSNEQKYYFATLNTLKAGMQYDVEITAYNDGGKSEVFKQDISASRCSRLENLECSISEKGEKWIEVAWESDADDSYNYQVKYQSNHAASNFKKILSSSAKKFNATDLQECVRYKITVCAVLNDVEQLCCHVTSFSKERVPKVAPKFVVRAVTQRAVYLSNLHGDWNESEACGNIHNYGIKYKSMEESTEEIKKLVASSKSTVRLPDLHPYTSYNISVAALNEAGLGAEKFLIVTTKEAKPDRPPDIIRAKMTSPDQLTVTWEAIKNPNGNITVYHIAVKYSESVLSLDRNCEDLNGSIVCEFNGNMKSAKLNISNAEIVRICGCTGNGKLCSDWSIERDVTPLHASRLSVFLVVTISCGGIFILFLALIILYRLSTKGPKPTKPSLHPDVMNEIQEALLEDATIKEDGQNQVKKLVDDLDSNSCNRTGIKCHNLEKKDIAMI